MDRRNLGSMDGMDFGASLQSGCMRDIHVPHPSDGGAVQIGFPADLSGDPCRNGEIYDQNTHPPNDFSNNSSSNCPAWKLLPVSILVTMTLAGLNSMASTLKKS